ncbi:MAG: DUF167 domain-containing protein [Sphingosinicella sp.]|nr:DUF167 domain-containing protein [Sphingomonas sp. CDS-1]MBA4757523.1 DUF167 domain-containing protein [Sphingosinicella sp.]
MARRRILFPSPDEIRALADEAGRLSIRVTPNASVDAVQMPADQDNGVLQVRVTATPEDGKANAAVLRLLADALKQPVSSLELLRGGGARHKLVRIAGTSS